MIELSPPCSTLVSPCVSIILLAMCNEKKQNLTLLSLPYELIDNILFYLESSDIVRLFHVSRSLLTLLNHSYHIISDEVKLFEQTIPKDCYTYIEDVMVDNLIAGYRGTFLLEIHDMRRSGGWFRDFIQALPMYSRCKISKYVNQPILGDSKFLEVVQLATKGKRKIKSIEVLDSTSFHLHHTTWDLSVFALPKVSTLLLSDCYIRKNGDYKLKFSNLINLYIDQGIHQVFESIELPQNLFLFGVSSNDAIIQGLYSNVLEDLRIQSSTISSIRDCEFPNLTDFIVLDSQVNELVNIKAPSLTNIVISSSSSQSSVLWRDVEFPNLESLTIIGGSISPEFFNVNCVKLEKATIHLYNQPFNELQDEGKYENPYSFLTNVKELNILGQCMHILKGLNFKELETLHIVKSFDCQHLKESTFPKLNRIVIKDSGDSLSRLSKLNAPLLQKVES